MWWEACILNLAWNGACNCFSICSQIIISGFKLSTTVHQCSEFNIFYFLISNLCVEPLLWSASVVPGEMSTKISHLSERHKVRLPHPPINTSCTTYYGTVAQGHNYFGPKYQSLPTKTNLEKEKEICWSKTVKPRGGGGVEGWKLWWW